ncbi:MAG: hypothetical protein RLY93_03650 [Sumerlaeia bacterium]
MHLWLRTQRCARAIFPLPSPGGQALPATGGACPARRFLPWLALAGLLLLTALIYAPVIRLPFMNEAPVEQNIIQGRSPFAFFLRSAYLHEGAGLYYRFGSRVVDQAINAIGPDTAAWNHTAQLLMHLACAALVFLFIRGPLVLGGAAAWRRDGPALAGAAVLALHPSIAAAVAATAVRWTITATLVFLALASAFQVLLVRASDRTARQTAIASAALSPAVFFLALVAEIGALAMGVLGLWLLIESLRRVPGPRRAAALLLPLAWAPLAYLIVRRVALGTLAQPYFAEEVTVRTRLLRYLRNFVNDIQLYANPIPLGIPGTAPVGLLAGIAASVLTVLLVLLLWRRSRAVLLGQPLPLLGVTCFCLFQLNALWLVPRPAIADSGIDRGYVYYLPVALLAILLGRVAEALWPRPGTPPAALWLRRGLAGVAGLLLLAAAWRTRVAVELWREGGAMMERHREQLAPLLASAPQGATLYLQDFPQELIRPYLPRVLTYYYLVHEMYLEDWAGGRDFRVLTNLNDPIPSAGGTVFLVADRDGKVVWTRFTPERAIAGWLSATQQIPDATGLNLLSRIRPGAPSGAAFAHLEPDEPSSDDGALAFRSTSTDSWIDLPLPPETYAASHLAVELRVVPRDPGGQSTFQVYFTSDGRPFGEDRSIARRVPADGTWHSVRVPLLENPSWAAAGPNFLRVRLDLTDREGLVELRQLQLQRDLSAVRAEISTP